MATSVSYTHLDVYKRQYYRCAEKKGYSGVGLWCRKKPERVSDMLGSSEFDAEGRYLRADFGKLSIVSLYQPSGSSSESRQEAKYRFMAFIDPHLRAPARSGQEVIVCADWNLSLIHISMKKTQQIVQTGNSDDWNIVVPLHFLHRRQGATTTFLSLIHI